MSFETIDLGDGYFVSAEYVGASKSLMEIIEAGVSIETVREVTKRVRQRYDEQVPRVVHSAIAIKREGDA